MTAFLRKQAAAEREEEKTLKKKAEPRKKNSPRNVKKFQYE